MAITATCACGKQYSVKDELAGRKAKCKACGQMFVIQQPAAAEEEIVELTIAPTPAAPQTPGLSPLGGDIVSAGFADPRATPGYQPYPSVGQALPAGMSGYPPPIPAQPGNGQQPYGGFTPTGAPYGQAAQPGAYNPLGQPAYPTGQPGYYGAPPPKPAASGNKPLILGAVGVVVAVVVGGITFVATQSLFSSKRQPTPIVSTPPTPPLPPSPTPVTTPAVPQPANPPPVIPSPVTPPVVSTNPATTPPPANWTASIDPAATSSQPFLAQPLNIEINPTDVERLTLSSPAVGRAVVGSRKENKGKLLIYDLAAGKKLSDWEAPKYSPAIQITSLSASGDYFAFSTATQETEVWSLKDNKQLAAFKAVQGADGLTSFVAMLDDGRLLTGSTSGTLALWKFPGEQKVWSKEKLGYFGMNVLGNQMALSPNRKLLVLFREGRFETLDVETGNSRGQLAAIPGLPPVAAVYGVAFHPDGKRLAATIFTPATNNSTVALWDLQSGALTQSFPIVAGTELSIPFSFGRRPGEAAPTWQASTGLQKATWWGDQHLLVGNRFVVDLAVKQVVARLNHSWGAIADAPLGSQICYAAGAKPHEPGQLLALSVPANRWQAALAAQAGGQTWLKPGTRVGLQLELDGPPTDAPRFKELLTQQLQARLATAGLVTDGQPEAIWSLRTRTETTEVTYRVHGFGRVGPPQEIKGRRLICNFALTAGGQQVWQKELRLDPPFAFSSHGQDDFAAAQLNAHWTTAAQDAINLFPWCLPKNAADKPLPLELTLEPGGVR